MADYKKKLKDAQGGVLPVTTADQVIVNEEDGTRLNSVLITAKFDPVESELSMPVNADTLAGEPADRYLKGKFYDSDPVDAVPVNADMLGGQLPGYFLTNIDLLWQNPNDNVEFPPQNISMPLSDYDFIIIEQNHYLRSVNGHLAKNVCMYPYIDGADQWVATMAWNIAVRGYEMHPNYMHFGNGAYYGTYGNSSQTSNNSHALPNRIYGLKLKGGDINGL